MFDLRKEREARGLSQIRLGHLIGLHWTTIQKWEKKGCIPPERILAVAKALDIKPSKIWPELASVESVDLRTARRAKNLTLQQLGNQMGLHMTVVHKWEKAAEVPPAHVPALAKVLGLRPVDLWPDLASLMP
jgi:transcriptional regulator with XRE-family HTH domain